MNRLLLLLPLTLCLTLPGCWQKDCSRWPFLNAGEYWLKVRNGYGYELLETRDEYICLAVQGDHDRWYRRVDRKLLTREVQEETYRIMVQRNIAQLKKELTRRETIDPRRLVYVRQGIDMSMRQLEDYTELHFDAPEQWLLWWEENHERLRLASDGRHMIVGP
jgi:hypothetical protein